MDHSAPTGLLIRGVAGIVVGFFGTLFIVLLSNRDPGGPGDARKHPISSLLIPISLLACGTWVYLAVQRYRVPFELEWCGGTMYEMTQRVATGKPLYPRVSSGWFPYEYPPLYFYVSAWISNSVNIGPYQAMRLVSIVSTLGICTLIFTWVVKLARGFSAFWATVAVGLFMASYRLTGAWFDIERLDMLFLFLSMLGLLLASKSLSPNLSEKSRPLFTIAAALVLLFAFMTKQQAILFVIGGFFAYCHSRAKRLSMLFLGTFLTSAVTWVFIADQTTGGGFSYYCFKVPAGNGIQLSLAKVFLVTDLPVIAPLILPALFGTIAISKHYPRRDNIQGIFLAWGTVSAFIGSILSRAHWGGDQNVLIPFYLFAIIWACIICSGVEYRTRQQSILVSLVCLLQFGIFAYRPQAQLPTVSQETAHSAYTQLIQDLEKNGEVLCVDHGNMTKAPHFHILGLLDVYHASKGLPEVVHEAIAGKKYAAIVVDAEDGLSGLVPDVSTYYTRKHRQGLESSWTVTGFQTPVSGRAVWVYLP